MSRVLVTGSTGYVGGRLAPRLLEQGHHVVCLIRNPKKLETAAWASQVEVVAGSVGDNDLSARLVDIDTAVYLVHSIGQSPDWARQEILDAENFRRTCEATGVGRIVYLGGLGDDAPNLSTHLSSRHSVGATLARGPIPVTELRAAVVIGSGSASFEMLRYLVEVLPIMITPKWVATKSQPIAVADVINYLIGAIEHPEPVDNVFEIGGPDVVSYAELMDLYAEVAGLRRRRFFPVPFLTPRLSSHWVGLVTPVPAKLARPLVDSLVNEVVVHSQLATQTFGPPTRTLRQAIELALGVTQRGEVPTTFNDADWQLFAAAPTDPHWAGGTVFTDVRTREVAATLEDTFATVCQIGGSKGWYSGEWLWRVRGAIDILFGGPGLRRGRRDPVRLHVGDPLDFWRVIEVEPSRLVRLRAEMLLPGTATLEWGLSETPGGIRVVQTATFRPRGLLGRIYWYAIAPFHGFVFPGLLSGIARDAHNETLPTTPGVQVQHHETSDLEVNASHDWPLPGSTTLPPDEKASSDGRRLEDD